MRRGAIAAASALAALLLCAQLAHASHAKLIYRVDKVSAVISGGKLIVDASGAVPSGGWTHPRLRLKASLPEAPVLHLDLLADPPPPKRVVIDVLLPVKAEIRTHLPRYGTVAVGVISQTNEVTTQIRVITTGRRPP